MAFTKYDSTAANNTAAPPNGMPEGMAPSAVNDAGRDMMAEIRLLGDGARGPLHLLTSVSGADTIVGSATPTLTAYAAGQRFVFIAAGTNTGAVTLNVNSVGAVAVKKGTASAALAAGDIPSGALVEVVYLTSPSTQFRVLSGGGAGLTPTLATLEALSLSAGDILYATAADTLTRLAKSTAGYRLVIGASSPSWLADIFGGGLLHVREEQASGTDGGTFTSGSFVKRTLNTTKTNEIASATVTSSVISLPAGTYYCEASAPAYKAGNHQLKLRDTTSPADLLIGSSERTDTGDGVTTRSIIRGRFTIAGTKNIELQHRCATTRSTDGLGNSANLGVVEVFAEICIWRIA